MVTIFRQQVKYQGYLAKAIQYASTAGFSPDPGWVLLDMEQVKKIIVDPFAAGNWRSVNGFEFDSGIDIRTWLKNRGRQTVTTPPEIPQRKGKGLNQFGNLRLESFVFEDGKQTFNLTAVTFVDVYVEESGIEDLGKAMGLAAQKKHNQGALFVPLTDVRKFYPDHGPFYGRINVRMTDGSWDEATIQDNGEAHPAETVIRFLFSQLVGSPLVLKSAKVADTLDDKNLKLDPPVNVIGKGEPAVEHLGKILKRLSLEPHRLPEGNYLVTRVGSTIAKYAHIPINPGISKKGRFQHAESQTSTVKPVSTVVQVRGLPRIRRTTESCIGCVEDEQGRIRPQSEWLEEIGFTPQQAGIQAVAPPEIAFDNITPAPVDIETTRLHEQRRAIAKKWIFKGYAPLANFVVRDVFDLGDPSSAVPLPGASVPVGPQGNQTKESLILDPDRTGTQLIPMHDFAAYEFELPQLSQRPPDDKLKRKGDLDSYFLIPPVVRANRFGPVVFRNLAELKGRFDLLIATDEDLIEGMWEPLIERKEIEAKKYGETLIAAAVKLKGAFSSERAEREFNVKTGIDDDFVILDDDVNRLLGFVNDFGLIDHRVLRRDMSAENIFTVQRIINIGKEIDDMRAKIEEIRVSIDEQKANFETFRRAFIDVGGVAIIGNIPHSVAPSSEYTVDRKTGVILFSRPAGHMVRPFILDEETPEDAIGIRVDGQVLVTFGYEYKTGGLMDWTTVLVAAKNVQTFKEKKVKGIIILEPAGTTVKPIVVGINRSTPMKPKIETAPKMRMYEADMGTPMNVTEVVTQAIDRATAHLVLPRQGVGFGYVFSGLQRAILDAGISAVQWEWPVARDAGRAHTTIAANAEATRALINPVGAVQRLKDAKAAAREILEAENDQ